MKSKIALLTISIFAGAVVIGACFSSSGQNGSTEQPVILIALDGPLSKSKAELSGLAWQDDMLILLPQYPERFGKEDGALFAIPKNEILDFLDGKSTQPITPTKIRFRAPGLKDSIQGFEGYEAIAFSGQNVYLTIESGKNEAMMGYLVGGQISADQSEIHIDTSRVVKIPPPVLIDNHTDEALIITGNRILTFFEVNGVKLNSNPVAHVFGLDLSQQGTISFPNLEYRVTDAALGPDGQIWVINYFYPEETYLLPEADPLAEKYGAASTYKKYPQVERLVLLNYAASGITLTDVAPIQLELIKDARNWEGLVALDQRGFLLVTDKFPGTMLAFVPMPK